MIQRQVAALVANVENAVGVVARSEDPEIHRLIDQLKASHIKAEKDALRRIAKQIVDHATYRYAAVVEAADRLLRDLDGAQ